MALAASLNVALRLADTWFVSATKIGFVAHGTAETDICFDIFQRLAKSGHLEDVHCCAYCKTAPCDALPLELGVAFADHLRWRCDCGRHDVNLQVTI